jgi:nitronate monooxygenase
MSDFTSSFSLSFRRIIMTAWPNNRIVELLGIEIPIIQAPMAGFGTPQLAIAAAEAGGLGSLPCALLGVEQTREAFALIRRHTARPISVNFFCHKLPDANPTRSFAWRAKLARYYVELKLDAEAPLPGAPVHAFDGDYCALIEEVRPEVVSFHFGLPDASLIERVLATGAKVISSATTIAEARWLAANGCDAIIAQGLEAGGHRGTFTSDDISTQVGTFALVPQIVDAVKVPVIAAGGIADARGIAAAFALGASAVQMGTAYLLCPEVNLPAVHRKALENAQDDSTVLTNVFSGRPARAIVNRVVREMGPMASGIPQFPLAGRALAPLRAKSEPLGSDDFAALWAGQAARLARQLPANELTRRLASEALDMISGDRSMH